MVIDLVLLGLVLFFAILGAITGAARQIANTVAIAVGYFVSRRLGVVVGPKLAEVFGGPLLLGVLAGTVLIFIGVLVVVRYVLGTLLRRLLSSGKDPDRGFDRALGFLLGGTKVALIAYVALSALTFVEQHVVVAGRRMGVSPKDSRAFGLARRYNLFERTQFAPLEDFVQVAQVAVDPSRAARLQNDPAFKSLRQDPRFQRALKDDSLRRALERGDHQALLRNDLILQLIQDPAFASRLGAAARAASRP